MRARAMSPRVAARPAYNSERPTSLPPPRACAHGRRPTARHARPRRDQEARQQEPPHPRLWRLRRDRVRRRRSHQGDREPRRHDQCVRARGDVPDAEVAVEAVVRVRRHRRAVRAREVADDDGRARVHRGGADGEDEEGAQHFFWSTRSSSGAAAAARTAPPSEMHFASATNRGKQRQNVRTSVSVIGTLLVGTSL